LKNVNKDGIQLIRLFVEYVKSVNFQSRNMINLLLVRMND